MPYAKDISLERMFRAVEIVRERLLKVTHLLDEAQIPYAVIGAQAASAWVAKVNPAAVRNTPDVDLLLGRDDFPRIVASMNAAGFCYSKFSTGEGFLESPDSDPRDAVCILFAGEKLPREFEYDAPDVSESHRGGEFQVINLEPLVRIELASFRIKNSVHLRDLIDVGLIDATWPARFPPVLAARLQELIDDPDG